MANGADGALTPSRARQIVWLKKDRNTILDCNSPAGRKVIRNISFKNPVFGLCKEIKTRVQKLADTQLILKAVIVLETTFEKMCNINRCQAELKVGNILFMDDAGGLRKVCFES